MRTVVIVIFIFVQLHCAASYKILMLAPVPFRSHYILCSTLAKGLAEAGHDVTIVAPFEETNLPKHGGYKQIILQQLTTSSNANLFRRGKMSLLHQITDLHFNGNGFTNFTFHDEHFRKFLKSKEKFDVVIMAQFVDDALKAVAHHFKAPLILFMCVGANYWVNSMVGNPSPISYVPDLFLSYKPQMTFWQRTVNFGMRTFEEAFAYFYFLPKQEQILKETFPDAPDLDTLNQNISLILLNSHESINQPVPLVPNMVQIGGYHISSPKPLPSDLKKVLDESEEGVIYFSLGSTVKPSEMSNETRDILIDAFGKLKQKVLWKWDDDKFEDKPKNVKISKWFQQQDILAHPNVKLFISHGGLLSTIETVYHGVPVLALPIFGDQYTNAQNIENAGVGLSIPFLDLTEEKFTQAVDDLLNDPKYFRNAKKRSTLMRDRPVKPLDLAVYWVEFIARNGGAPHLMVAGADQPFYKYILLDIIGFIAAVIVSIYLVLKCIFRSLCSSKKLNVKEKTN